MLDDDEMVGHIKGVGKAEDARNKENTGDARELENTGDARDKGDARVKIASRDNIGAADRRN